MLIEAEGFISALNQKDLFKLLKSYDDWYKKLICLAMLKKVIIQEVNEKGCFYC